MGYINGLDESREPSISTDSTLTDPVDWLEGGGVIAPQVGKESEVLMKEPLKRGKNDGQALRRGHRKGRSGLSVSSVVSDDSWKAMQRVSVVSVFLVPSLFFPIVVYMVLTDIYERLQHLSSFPVL